MSEGDCTKETATSGTLCQIKRSYKQFLAACLVLGISYSIDQLPYRGGLEVMDAYALKVSDETLERASEIFVVSKAINMVLSVAKTAQVNVGVGASASFVPGAFLDPLDQLIDDFTNWLLEGVTAVAIVKVSLVVVGQLGMFGTMLLIAPLLFLMHLLNGGTSVRNASAFKMLRAALVLVLVIRFAFPIAIWSTNPVTHAMLDGPYVEAVTELRRLGWANDDISFSYGAVESVKAAAHAIVTESKPFFRSLGVVAGVFVMQIIILPLAMVWLYWRIMRWIVEMASA